MGNFGELVLVLGDLHMPQKATSIHESFKRYAEFRRSSILFWKKTNLESSLTKDASSKQNETCDLRGKY